MSQSMFLCFQSVDRNFCGKNTTHRFKPVYHMENSKQFFMKKTKIGLYHCCRSLLALFCTHFNRLFVHRHQIECSFSILNKYICHNNTNKRSKVFSIENILLIEIDFDAQKKRRKMSFNIVHGNEKQRWKSIRNSLEAKTFAQNLPLLSVCVCHSLRSFIFFFH